jgi:hypothetical protein
MERKRNVEFYAIKDGPPYIAILQKKSAQASLHAELKIGAMQ